METIATEKHIQYRTEGTCSSAISITIRDGLIAAVSFSDGCQGNLEGISRLVVGLEPIEVARRLKGIRCGSKSTSCPDQLVRALERAGLVG